MTNAAQTPQPAVAMRHIMKAFGGVRALKGVNFDVMPGEIHALLGENGAGKSTLMKILQGVHQPDSGEIRIQGELVEIKNPQDATQHGIGMVFQELSLIHTLTVAQNIFLTRETTSAAGTLNDRSDEERALALFERMQVNINPRTPISQLSAGYQQLSEIAKALSQDAHILILDEPTTALTDSETQALFGLLRRLKEQGIAIIYISHRMEEIFHIADRITVLRDGSHIITDSTDHLSLETVIEHIVGEKSERTLQWESHPVDRNQTPLLEVSDLVLSPLLEKIELQLYPGEIIGIAGLMGSGRTELAEVLFGIRRIEQGSIRVRGQIVEIRNPRDALHNGVALIPENRRLQGLVLAHSLRDNFLLPLIALGRLTRSGVLVNDRKGDQITQTFTERLKVRMSSFYAALRSLSGGNQQKIVIAKWLSVDPDILIMDEPTAGVDIGTKLEIVDIIRQLADQGKGVIVISSEMPELLAVSDRIYVLRDGQFKTVLNREDITTEEQLHHMIQGD